MKWQLVVEQGKRKGLVIPISRAPFTIGRDAGCQLRPVAASVGEQHCQLVTHGSNLVVVDCQTTNGTFVNEERVAVRQELRPGDHLRIGPLEFLIDLAAATSPPPRGPLDEDAIGDMLLAMDEEDAPSASATPERSASSATIPEGAAISSQDTRPDHVALGARPMAPLPQTPPRGGTGNAAREIIGAYVRRPRG